MATLKSGETFAKRYELIRLLDNGGFADVWEAKDTEARDHTVALKIYPMLDADGIRNIEEEYDVQKDLSHSTLLTVRHFGKDDEGRPYLVMRFCSGGNAAKHLGNYTELEIALVMQKVGSALSYLHQENLVHQDIKPNNILIDHRDGQEYIFLADLGLSLKLRSTIRKFTESKKSNTNSIQTGMNPPPYRAPELWGKGNVNKEPIKATDIWAFGATLFELITGDVPFGEFGGVNQLSDPTPPNLPADFKCSNNDLNEIIKRCLAKDAWDRPKATELTLWATNFIETGKWHISDKPFTPNPIIPDPVPPVIVPIIPDSRPAPWKEWAKWVAIIGLGVLLAYGIDRFWFGEKKRQQEVILRPEEKDDDLQKKEENSTALPADSNRAVINAPSVTPPRPREAAVKTLTRTESSSISNPRVDNPPQNANIRITYIKRTPEALTIGLLLTRNKEDTDDSKYAIYGTENPQYAFYVRDAARNMYRLRSLEGGTNGQSVTWGSRRSHAFTATFEPLPSHLRIVDIREAEERNPGQSYWNFGGVHLP